MKKFVSFALVVILVLSLALPAFAAPSVSSGYDGRPLVIVRGMDLEGLSFDPNTENPHNYLNEISVSNILFGLGKAIVSCIFELRAEALVDGIILVIRDIFSPIACDENGDPACNVGKKDYSLALSNYPEDHFELGVENEYGITHTAIERYGAENTYYVNYDWRLNPMDVADYINQIVNRALTDSGKDKVNLICASMGGVMTVAYLTEYGYSKVDRCIFLSSTFCGTYVASDLLSGKIKFSGETLSNMLTSSGSDALKLLDKLGVFDLAAKYLAKFADKYKDRVYDLFLDDVFGNMLSLWAIVLPDEYEDCLDYMFGGRPAQRAAFIAKADALQLMMRGRDALLRNAKRDGVKIAVVATYDMPLIPVYERACQNGDNTLETAPMSGWATVAPYGKTLDEDYISAHADTVSPDGVIDVSTALFPENTWLIKGAPHISCRYGSDFSDFVFSLVDFDGDLVVKSFPQYPQFMLSGEDQSLNSF